MILSGFYLKNANFYFQLWLVKVGQTDWALFALGITQGPSATTAGGTTRWTAGSVKTLVNSLWKEF
jgi:hypothetical protein